MPVQYVKGIGPARALRLERLGIKTVEDLLFHLPARYIDRSNPIALSKVELGREATVVVKVLGSKFRYSRRGPILELLASEDGDFSSQIFVLWFNRPDLRGKFKDGERLILSGQVSFYGQRQMINPFFERFDENPDFFERAVFPIYPLTEGLAAWEIRKAVAKVLDEIEDIPETLTDETLERMRLPGIRRTLEMVHRPRNASEPAVAVNRLRYEELFYLQTVVTLRRKALDENLSAKPLSGDGRLTAALTAGLPFTLTDDQRKAMEEIASDVRRTRPMHRLLEGDVGSGKTVVALYAMLRAVECGMQGVLMAPTELLAEQHYNGWRERLESIGARSLLLTGSIAAARKEECSRMIASGEANVVFGTHALIEEHVKFANLGLVVVDEQHRFGVMQRAALRDKGEETPHLLVMSATPIPRTLTMTYYGDLNLSILKDKPKGRAERRTDIAYESRRAGVYRWLKEKLEEGDRAYVVAPLIDESEKLDVSSAKETYEELKELLGEERIALLHGRIRPRERTETMERFRTGEVNVLVSTTVIEVGVDVPEATIMIIRHPERFGLAQLHQLRGRIGRGARPSRCVLLLPSGLPEESRKRLSFFSQTEDGFALAEEDLRLRGPGEIMGTRQHGLPDLRVADLVRDRELLELAKRDAGEIINRDPTLKENQRIARTIRRRYSQAIELLGVA